MRALLLGLVIAARTASAAPRLVAVVGADDARAATVIGAGGEVYEGDGRGGWLHRLPARTATPLSAAGRAGAEVVAAGGGVVYRLAGNGWSAVRLVQHGKAVLGAGSRAIAAVGRQLFALDRLTRGEPTKLGLAPGNVVALAASAAGIVVATDAGVFRLAGKPAVIRGAPRGLRLVSERWAIVDGGALALATGKRTAWPAGLAVGPAAVAPDGALVLVASGRAGLELLVVRDGAPSRDPLGITGEAVGVAVDRAGRAVVALADGRVALRTQGWAVTEVKDAPGEVRPGAGPATEGARSATEVSGSPPP